MRRPLIALAAAAVALTTASAASAKNACSVPDQPAWHSCLSARHTAQADGDVELNRATPALVIRLAGPCPAHLAKRTVVLRTNTGKRLARTRVRGRCHNGVARFRVNIRPQELQLPPRTVIRSYWSGIADSKNAPKVKLNED